MHHIIYQEFEQICSDLKVDGPILEIGATPSKDTLLCMACLENIKEKLGINLDGPHEYNDIKILQGNSNSLPFVDNSFGTVLCNAVLEHDPFFWKTIEEIKRVTRSGGLIIIGTPGYSKLPIEKLQFYLQKLPVLNKLKNNRLFNFLFSATLTYKVHNTPGDYYRFSEQAYKEVLLSDLKELEVRTVMVPPRVIAFGFKQ